MRPDYTCKHSWDVCRVNGVSGKEVEKVEGEGDEQRTVHHEADIEGEYVNGFLLFT